MNARCKHGAPWWRNDCPLCGRNLEAERRAEVERELSKAWLDRRSKNAQMISARIPGPGVLLLLQSMGEA